jgi:DNA end-binding protein Ku
MATIWKGSLSFGLVTIPVEMRSAVQSDHISFRLLHAEDLSPVKYERVSQRTGEPVPWDEIVKGYEYEKGKFVVLTDDDFKAAALEGAKSLEILDFVKAEEIDPRYFETPYFLVPAKGGEKAYALLREAMRNSDGVGIGKIILRQKQHLAGIRVIGEALVLEIMRFANELVDPTSLAFPKGDVVRAQELRMAEQLVANLAEPFDPDKYTDEYRANLMKLIRAKMKGKKIRHVEKPEDAGDTQVIDLMSRLQASLARGAGAKGAGAKGAGAKGASVRGARKRGASAKAKKPARGRSKKTA